MAVHVLVLVRRAWGTAHAATNAAERSPGGTDVPSQVDSAVQLAWLAAETCVETRHHLLLTMMHAADSCIVVASLRQVSLCSRPATCDFSHKRNDEGCQCDNHSPASVPSVSRSPNYAHSSAPTGLSAAAWRAATAERWTASRAATAACKCTTASIRGRIREVASRGQCLPAVRSR